MANEKLRRCFVSSNWEQILLGHMNQGMTWESAISEIWDNSLDKDANLITLKTERRAFSNEDNGVGTENIGAFFGHGTHDASGSKGSKTPALGHWGVGGKHAMTWISSDMKSNVSIVSKTRDVALEISMLWKDIAAMLGSAEPAFYATEKPNALGVTGCLIKLNGPLRQFPHGRDYESLIDRLQFRYSRALESGVTIRIERNGVKRDLVSQVPPALSDEIVESFQVNGKPVDIRVGLVPPGQYVQRCGLHYRYSYRVIRDSSRDGCGEYSSSHIFGFVDLGTEWKTSLDIHKSKIVGKDTRELYAEVYRRIEPLLKKAQSQTIDVQSQQLADRVAARMETAVGAPDKKAKRRSKKNQTGAVEPTGKGSGHTRAEKTQPGNRFGNGESVGVARGFRIEFAEFPPGDQRIGDACDGNVRLNLRVSEVLRARNSGDDSFVYMCALIVYYTSTLTRGTRQQELYADPIKLEQELCRCIGEALSCQVTFDGRPVLGLVKSDQAAE